MRSIKDVKSNGRQGPFPKMGGILSAWQSTMKFKLITDTLVDYVITKTETSYDFEGVFQPMPARELVLKPEGQRNWKWWKLWTRTDYKISNSDIIEDYNGVRFKVMKQSGWNQAGYVQYDLVEEYEETA